jgi:Superfamily II DNA and RNA helicases
LNNFKSQKTRVLIATDIAARGIDVDQLELVINYDLPDVPETYVHRIGRTGRAGNSGTALTFCSAEENAMLNDIQKLTGKKLNQLSIPA